MVLRTAFSLALTLLLAAPSLAAAPAYTIGATVPLGPPDRWDYIGFDPAAHRAYVAHGTEITVVDVETGAVVGRVPGVGGAHGVVVVPALGRGYADSGDTDTVIVFDLQTFKPLATLKTGSGPDAMAVDPSIARVFAINGDGASVTAIDAATDKVVGTVALGGQPEFAQSDEAGKLFVNIEGNSEIVRIDEATLKIEARFKIAECEAPHGLAIDTAHRRVFSTCVNARMMVVDAGDGHIVATLPIGKGTDAAGFDPARQRAFSSNGDGTLSIVAETDPDHFSALGEIPTRPGARTMALDPTTGRIFLVTGETIGQDPPRRPGGAPKFRFKPGSVALLVLSPES